MAVQFIAGPSGSGKSHYIYSRITKESAGDKEARFFVCVPEQFTMQTQKELVRLHPRHSIMNIDVCSFNRLAARVFDETGFDAGTVLEDMGKTLLLQKVVWDNKNALTVLGKTLNRPGGVEEMKSLVSEFMQYRVSPSDLKDLAREEELPPLLERKLSDLEIVYQKLKDCLAGKYMAAEEVCEALSSVIRDSRMVKNATFVFDGFTGFVPVQLMVLREICKVAKKVYVVITAEEKAGLIRKSRPADLFHMSHQMAEGVMQSAKEAGAETEDTIWIKDGAPQEQHKAGVPQEQHKAGVPQEQHKASQGRFKNSAPLSFLEENIFRKSAKQYEYDLTDISVIRSDNKEDETAAAAAMISRLVRTQKYRYREIAVICSDISAYGRSMQRILEDSKIPCFLDEKQSVAANPFVQFIHGAARIMADNFSYDTVFAYLKSGLSSLTTEEIDRLENYVLAAGIQGYKKYSSIWTKCPKRFSEEEVLYLNTLRKRLIDELEEVITVFRTRMSPVGEKTRALYNLAVKCEAQQKLKIREVRFADAHDKAKEKEYAQIYKAVVDLFDKMVQILGEERIGTAAYAKLLEAGFGQMKLGIIPTGPDEVFIGDIERSRVKNVKVLLFLGLNDGLVPKHSNHAGLLNESDRETLRNNGMELSPSNVEDMFRQRFYLYLTLTLASERLFLFYKKADEDGKGMLPSYLIGTMMKLFPKMSVTDSDKIPLLSLETGQGQRAGFLSGLPYAENGEAAFFELYRNLKDDPDGERIIEEVIRGAGITKKDTDISADEAAGIYPDSYSVTRLQLFANCAFAHFLKYGIKLQERRIYEMNAADVGSIFHDVIYRFFLLAEEEGGMKGLSEKKTDELADKAFEEAVGACDSTVMLESARNLAQTRRMKRMIRSTIRAVKKQMEAGDFVTEGTEVPYFIGKLAGKIDRYDVCRIGDTAYVRVIDYKSGQTRVDYTGMVYGLQIQLPVYLNAALDRVGKTADAKAAGIYYLGIKTPMIEAGSMEEEVGYEKFLKEMRFSGLTLDDPEVVAMQDADAAAGTVLPIRLKKNGEFYKGTPVISEGDFRLIERYTKRLVEELEHAIESGKAGIEPAAKKWDDAGHCEYCEYKGVCGYDPRIPGYKHRLLENVTRDTVCMEMNKRL